ncbi:hypothetical protein NOGI109294_02365 [Nocardiopsis gilva]|uniref:hypothetical protein n=1 Tax=Nocardiopsis gilva TaxID=280236 RepID=UPI00034D0D86|nr:hypothetical protein [Nocardiopsis gilva]
MTPIRTLAVGVTTTGLVLSLGIVPASAVTQPQAAGLATQAAAVTTSPAHAEGASLTAAVPEGVTAATGKACRKHNPHGKGWARACRTWYSIGGGYYKGSFWWKGKHVKVQAWLDGRIIDIPRKGKYYRVKEFLTRACNKHECTRF